MVDLYGFWGDGYVVSWINYIIVVSWEMADFGEMVM